MSSDRLIHTIAASSTKRIQDELNALANTSLSEILSADSLKQAILDDPFIEVTAISAGKFKAFTNNGTLFKEAILRDFYFGYTRVKAQHKTLRSLKAGKIAPPWDLTTAYYCAFFSAIELLRLQGLFQVSFDRCEHIELLRKANGNTDHLRSVTNFTGRLSSCGEQIVFSTNGQKPHQSVWNNIAEVITSPLAEKHPEWKEILTLNLIFKGSQNWEKPSDIRNHWNYKKAELYSDISKPITNEFYSIIENSKSACLWLARSLGSVPTDQSRASSIAAVCEVLSSSVIHSYIDSNTQTDTSDISTRNPRQHKSRRAKKRAKGKQRRQSRK